MILVIDNYDSFTYNVVQYLGELGAEMQVYRNDKISLREIADLAPSRIVISPGPCTPNEAGISLDVIRTFHERIPILGICLGHQCIGQALGGRVVRARKVMHGKTSDICHLKSYLFHQLPESFEIARYHSLVVELESLPDCLELSAWTTTVDGEVDEVMGLRHNRFPVFGVQFHPESIASQQGHKLLQNFLECA